MTEGGRAHGQEMRNLHGDCVVRPSEASGYAYYPNPFFVDDERQKQLQKYQELVQADLLSGEDFFAMIRGDLDPEMRAPLIRYENAPSQRKRLSHPCSHFHIGHHADNRWPLARVLTPVAFSMWIAKQYYGERWRIFSDDEHEVGNELELELITERQNCRIIGDDMFDANEKRSFHID